MRVYDKEFKEEAIKLSYEVGPTTASAQLGIPSTTLYTWRSQRKKDATKHSEKEMCKVLQVSEAGYYRWRRTQNRPYKYDDLLAKIRQIRAENTDYGAYRIYLALQLFHGYIGTYNVVRRLCKTHQLMLKKNHHAKGTTKADPAAQASENLIKQDFTATAPKHKWLGDITEIPTAEGRL